MRLLTFAKCMCNKLILDRLVLVRAAAAATCRQFDKYMNEYKRTHPGLTDHDLPRFEDMDHNNNGHINFHEVCLYAHVDPSPVLTPKTVAF